MQLVLVYVFIYSHECHKFKFPFVKCTDCAEKLHVVSHSQLRPKLHSTERGGGLWVGGGGGWCAGGIVLSCRDTFNKLRLGLTYSDKQTQFRLLHIVTFIRHHEAIVRYMDHPAAVFM